MTIPKTFSFLAAVLLATVLAVLPLPARSAPLGIVVSGGGSLGVWEGGFLYTTLAALRADRASADLELVAGTSAGAINALVTVLEGCGGEVQDPTESLFYRTWEPIRAQDLFRPESVSPVGVFDRSAFDAAIERLRSRFDDGAPPDCDVLLGMTMTRVTGRVQPMAAGTLRLSRTGERVLVRVQGRGRGAPLAVRNGGSAADRFGWTALPLEGPEARPFDSLRAVALASSAFPLAFGPQAVATCPLDHEGPCSPDVAEVDDYLDGGFFDTQPLDIAVWALAERDPDPTYLFVDPTPRRYPTAPVAPREEPSDLLGLVQRLAGDFVTSSRASALQTVLIQSPDVEAQLWVTQSSHPPYGDLLGAFLALFERDFRRFDFALGMLSAEDALVERGFTPPPVPAVGEGWDTYRCVRSVLRADSPDCDGVDGSLVALAEVARERVYDACRPDRLPADPGARERASQHPDCRAALAGRRPPGAGSDWARTPEEPEIRWVFRRLAARGFTFRDLGPTRDGDEAWEALAGQLEAMGHALADQQGVLAPAVRSAIDLLAEGALDYRPERHAAYLDVGPNIEIGWTALPSRRVPWLRLTAALDVDGLETILSNAPNAFGLAPVAGVEFELTPVSSSVFAPRIAVRGGYLFSDGDGFLTGDCDVSEEPVRPCSRPIVQLAARAMVVRILRLSLVGEWGPPVRPGEASLWSIRPTLGAQLTFD